MKSPILFPLSGGSYRVENGQLVREGEISNTDPSLPLAPPIEHGDQPTVVDGTAHTADPGESLPPIKTTSAPRSRRANRED